jgi:hypothetical protein
MLNLGTDDPAEEDYHAQPMEKTVGSTANFTLARNWLEECERLHPSCTTSTQRSMPRRLLELYWISSMSQPTIHLIIPTENVNYAALTYCWGDPQLMESTKLTTRTCDAWQDDIPFEKLPKTLQDAIITTVLLEIRFLWVDCLCILQDDDHEKAIEISKMPHIYRGAYITISQ